jgi:hypothetical protein
VLAQLEHVGPLLQQALQAARLVRVEEVHTPRAEIDRLREPPAGLNPRGCVPDEGGVRRA